MKKFIILPLILVLLIFLYKNIDIDKNVSSLNIAIIDSGVNYNVKNLSKFDIYSNKESTKDIYGHGTAVFEVLKENVSNFEKHNFFDIKVLNDTGTTTSKNFCKGIDYAIKKKADIINVSLGFNDRNGVIDRCISNALNKNILIIAASGDTLSSNIDYPARYKDVISVSAIDEKKNLFSFSSKGDIDYVDYGVNIKVPSRKDPVSGSSFATAKVTAKYISYLEKDNNSLKFEKIGTNYKILMYDV